MLDDESAVDRAIHEPAAEGVEVGSLHSAITAILKDHPDGMTPVDIVDSFFCLHVDGKADKRNGSYLWRVASEIVTGGFRVRGGKYFLPSARA